MAIVSNESENLLTPGEVATMFRVDPKTVSRWANDGKLSAYRTLGGHRRFKEDEVLELRAAHGVFDAHGVLDERIPA
ncbi:MAG: BldC family transcriptional regulator [Cellulomonadaceae bacterium]|nr:BldC family transcriptional regulator [Cellulomonadaceae bacterium]